MDTTSVNDPDESGSTELDENQTNVELEDQDGAPDGSEGEDGQEPDGQEVEIVLTGNEGSQPAQSDLGIRKRINKLNAKVSAAQTSESQVAAENETLRQQNELLRMAQEQQQAKPKGPPDPNDFDDGAKDAKYVEALESHNREFFRAEMEKHTAAQPTQPTAVDRALERRQTQHYEAADKLGIPDYAEVEDKTVGILGKDTVNHLIKAVDNSPSLLYYLGKNPAKAEEIADMLKGPDAIKGILELGALSKGLVAQPKAKRNLAPDPDDELIGSSPPRSKKGARGPEGATFT